jgi:hypothetical protein
MVNFSANKAQICKRGGGGKLTQVAEFLCQTGRKVLSRFGNTEFYRRMETEFVIGTLPYTTHTVNVCLYINIQNLVSGFYRLWREHEFFV